jgi:protein deglycase
MAKVALLLFPGFSEFEISVAASILNRRYTIETLAQTTQPLVSEAGFLFLPHISVSVADPASYAALIIPGGTDLSTVMDDPVVHTFVQSCDQHRTLLAAICAGPIILAKAGVLKTHTYTTSLYRRFRDHLGCFNEQGFQSVSLVESDHILTAQGSAFVEFGIRLAERLDAMGDAVAVRAYYRGQGDMYWED